MYLVGLTGGIASGKSIVARHFVDEGAVLIDADVIAREVVENGTPGLIAIVKRFGEGVLLADGSLDRDALGEIVFADEAARRDLEALTHPLIGAEIMRRLAKSADSGQIVVLDAALLVEGGRTGLDCLVVVAAKPEVQLQRLVGDRGMTREDADARVAAQAPLEEKLAKADFVVGNEGSLADLASNCESVWKQVKNGADAKPMTSD